MTRVKRILPLLCTVPVMLACGVAARAQDDPGFAISIDGAPVAGNPAIAKPTPRAVAPQSRADIRVQADGLGARPRLDLQVSQADGRRAVVQSEVNYPSWIARAELRVFDMTNPAGPKLVQTVPIAPNGRAELALPAPAVPLSDRVGDRAEGSDFAVVHRVYDAQGRFDETEPVALSRSTTITEEEEGTDRTARRRIPVTGGAVTVSGTGLAPGATVTTLGETIRPDASGNFVVQRILPAGEARVPVEVTGGGENIRIEPVVEIAKVDWFHVATVDLTFGKTLSGPEKGETFDRGRLAFYAKGRTASGWTITGSADTGEHELDSLFDDFMRKDPQGLLMRLDEDMAYPTYGDDAEILNDAPTDGRFYLKAEKDGSFIMWGNEKAQLNGGYLRNERALYGIHGRYVSPAQTSRGQSQLSVTGYAAQPDMLPGRESFLGTGGSIYFLGRQDIAVGSETLTVEIRDPVSGLVAEQRTLGPGRDYEINYMQGVITLAAPLSGLVTGGVVRPGAAEADQSRLVVQYEYEPTAGDVDGYTYGGRVESWVTDQLRLGVTGMVEQTDSADQTATGIDLRWELDERSFAEVEYARTEGPGFGSTWSEDGGLTIDTRPTAGLTDGTGSAFRFAGQADLTDLGLRTEGEVAAYFERRGAGFSTLDHQVDDDETLWGVAADIRPEGPLSWRIAYDDFQSDDGEHKKEGVAALSYVLSERFTIEAGIAHLDRNDPTEPEKTGERTDLGLRLTYSQSSGSAVYVFGQTTVNHSGGLEKNNRLGVGFTRSFANGWAFEGEVSGGSLGAGGKAVVRQEREGSSAYVGYTLDPGRELDNVTLNGRDKGRFVAGGRRQISDNVSAFGENAYDMFGRRRALTSAYGVEYSYSETLSFTGAFEMGRVTSEDDDFDRKALSFGAIYEQPEGLTARARLELRRDRGVSDGTDRDADTILLTADASYKIDESQRLLFSLDHADTDTDGTSVLNGRYTKAVLGYAYRPIEDDRLNLLLRYTYLNDMYGQITDGGSTDGSRQKSHVFSVDAIWEVSDRWELGGKVGVRRSESAPDDTLPLQRNDASLVVLNARYHLTHQWDVLLEARQLDARQAEFSETGFLAAAYRQINPNLSVGLGYNFGSFSDDLTDLTQDDEGIFINLIAQF